MRTHGNLLSALLLLLTWGAGTATAEELKDPFQGIEGIKGTFRGAALTETQMVEILEFRRATTWSRERQIEQEKDAAWQAWKDLASGASVEATTLNALTDRFHQLNAERDRLRTQVVLKIREMLTADQLKRVSQTHQTIKELDVQRRALDPTVEAEREQ